MQSIDPEEYVRQTAIEKGKQVFVTLNDPSALVIGADTIVVLNGEILEKPKNISAAKEMLQKLAGKTHQVKTAIALLSFAKSRDLESFETKDVVFTKHELEFTCESHVESTFVEFSALTDELIDAYIATGEPMDKAGGYGIQGLAAIFITGINGCFYNVMGLPLARLISQLEKVL